ncbi:MAG TPA: hypothetical protein VLC51_01160 [Nitrospira sp.]|nr:hypothetical protein [Nitrospira sp.]
MSIEIPMRRDGNHLVPADQVAAEMLAEVPTNTGVMVTVKVPRNLRQFRLAWALADLVSKSVDFLPDRETAMDWLKIKSRHVRMIHDPVRGTTAIVPKSIAFQSLDQTGFRRVLDRMIYVTTTEIIPGLDEGALRAELEAIVGIDDKPTRRKSNRREVVGKPTVSAGQEEILHHVAPGDSPPPEGRPEGRKKLRSTARASSSEGKEAGATGGDEHREPTASGDAKPPTTAKEYVERARGWIAKQRDHAFALNYFDSEEQVKLRAACKLSVGENKMLHRELAQHFEANNVSS